MTANTMYCNDILDGKIDILQYSDVDFYALPLGVICYELTQENFHSYVTDIRNRIIIRFGKNSDTYNRVFAESYIQELPCRFNCGCMFELDFSRIAHEKTHTVLTKKITE